MNFSTASTEQGFATRSGANSVPAGFIAIGIPVTVIAGAAVVYFPVLAVAVIAGLVVLGAWRLLNVSIPGGLAGILLFAELGIGAAFSRGYVDNSSSFALLAIILALFVVSVVRPARRMSAALIASAAFAAIAALEAINPILPSIGYGFTGAYALVLPTLVIITIARLRLSPNDVRFIWWMIALGWAFSLALALRQWAVGFTPEELAFISANRSTFIVDDQVRLLGASRSNQDFAFFVGTAFASLAVAFIYSKGNLRRVALALFLGLTTAALFGSLVRSGLVGGLIGATAGALAAAPNPKRLIQVIAVGLAVTSLLWAFVEFGSSTVVSPHQATILRERAASITNPTGDSAFFDRLHYVWPRSVRLAVDHPFGAGSGSAGPLSQSDPGAPLGPVIADNGYLSIWIQLGILGLIAFIAMLLTVTIELLRTARRGSVAAAMGLASTLALVVGMITLGFWGLNAPATIFAAIVGLGLNPASSRGPTSIRDPLEGVAVDSAPDDTELSVA